jgi:uncharacterized OB-fold protein
MPSARYWREIPTRYRLEASKCGKCGRVSYPRRKVCPACRARELKDTNLSLNGEVVTATAVHAAPTDLANEAPYAMALVETPEKCRLLVQVADCDPSDVKAGMKVRLEFRKIRKEGHTGILCYGHKAVPA